MSQTVGGQTSKFFENKQLIHIVSEAVVLLGISFYFSSQNKKLMNHIEELAHRLEEQDDKIQKLTTTLEQMGKSLSTIPIKEIIGKIEQQESVISGLENTIYLIEQSSRMVKKSSNKSMKAQKEPKSQKAQKVHKEPKESKNRNAADDTSNDEPDVTDEETINTNDALRRKRGFNEKNIHDSRKSKMSSAQDEREIFRKNLVNPQLTKQFTASEVIKNLMNPSLLGSIVIETAQSVQSAQAVPRPNLPAQETMKTRNEKIVEEAELDQEIQDELDELNTTVSEENVSDVEDEDIEDVTEDV